MCIFEERWKAPIEWESGCGHASGRGSGRREEALVVCELLQLLVVVFAGKREGKHRRCRFRFKAREKGDTFQMGRASRFALLRLLEHI